MEFKKSKLWSRLETDKELSQCVLDIRTNCIALGETIKNQIPGFTDHSIVHMDALWYVADTVFTESEINLFSTGEIFILGCSFYFHDLGMSLGATKEGLEKLKANEKYASYKARLIDHFSLKPDDAELLALRLTSRALHAETAIKLCSDKVPGLDRFIIEKESIRNSWSNYIGEVSASHHWSINELEQKLGKRGQIPSPKKDNIDLAFIACALRIIDYSHINSERANYIEILLRLNIDEESLLHWKAQENINGPSRYENRLKYVSNKPIEDVEAWWLFFDMVSGLDKEIVEVSEYLETKTWSQKRFSLEGVYHVKTPKNFSALVRTKNFEPIDIRFKPDSIERLVEILGGKTLYGNDQFAPLRELLQNSRDAILLRQKQEDEIEGDYHGKITISIDATSHLTKLIVKDNGIGMDSKVIQDYLLGIASDYWNSQDYYNDFPNAKAKGFTPTGKFGIGFLSVFMIGDNISVETERKARNNLRLSLKGLGKHGSLIATASTGNVGTSITIAIDTNKQKPDIYNNLELVVKARAPMLSFPVAIKSPTQSSTIQAGWWKTITQRDFFDFISKWDSFSSSEPSEDYLQIRYLRTRYRDQIDFDSVERFKKWPGKQPEIIEENFRLLAIPDFGKVILCSRGIAVKTIMFNGLTGIVNIDDLTLTASRKETIRLETDEFIEKVKSKIRPKIIEGLNLLESEGMVTSRFEFIIKVLKIYGANILNDIALPWVSAFIPPGDVRLFNTKDAIELIKSKDEILLSYGTGPWSTEEICRNYFPSASDSALILPITQKAQPDYGDYSEKDIVTMDTLPKQMKSKDRDEDENEIASERYKEAVFLMSTIKLISIAWTVNEAKLINYQWLRKRREHLCVHFVRKTL